MFRFLCAPSFTKCGFEQNLEVKTIILLLGGEFKPVSRVMGVDADHYTTEELRYYIIGVPFFSNSQRCFQIKS